MLNTNDYLPGKYQKKTSPVQKPVTDSRPPVPNLSPIEKPEKVAPISPPPVIKPIVKPKKKNNAVVGIVVFLLLAAGAGASFLLMKQNQDNRQQAYIPEDVDVPYPTETVDPNNGGGGGGGGIPTESPTTTPTLTASPTQAAGCVSGWYACNVGCCGIGGTENEGKRYAPALGTGTIWDPGEDLSLREDGDEIQAAIVNELKSRGLVNDNGTIRLTENFELEEYFTTEDGKKVYDYCYGDDGILDTDKCYLMPGGYLYIGGSRDGDPCAPVLNGGGDWCAVIAGDGSTTEEQYCSSLGLIRCICNNGIGVIGSQGQSCDDLCGGTDNICESCDDDDGEDEPTGTPEPDSLMCRRIDILDAQNNILSENDDDSFVPGETELKFKCAASDNEQVDHFEFQLLAPPNDTYNFSQTITLAEDPLSKGISESYLIETAGSYKVQCRICETTDSCQVWEEDWSDIQYSIN